MHINYDISCFHLHWWSKNPKMNGRKARVATPKQKTVAPEVTYPWWLFPHKKIRQQLFPEILMIQKNFESCWLRGTTRMRSTPCLSPHASRMRGTTQLECETPLVRLKATPQKTSISLESFERYWWSKNSAIWLEKRYNCPNSTTNFNLRCCLPLMIVSMQKIWKFDWFLPAVLMIRQSC